MVHKKKPNHIIGSKNIFIKKYPLIFELLPILKHISLPTSVAITINTRKIKNNVMLFFLEINIFKKI
jgi:hypothetical protein